MIEQLEQAKRDRTLPIEQEHFDNLTAAIRSSFSPNDQFFQTYANWINQLGLVVNTQTLQMAMVANVLLGRALKQLRPTDALAIDPREDAPHRFGLALSQALTLNLPESAISIARDLLDSVQADVQFLQINNRWAPRSDIEEISRGTMPASDEDQRQIENKYRALEDAWKKVSEGRWAPNVHLGGLLSAGADTWKAILLQNQRITPPSLVATVKNIRAFLGDDTEAIAGLDFALSKNDPVNEGALQTGIEEVLRHVWAYCTRQSDGWLRANLMTAFAGRLRDIHQEKPCNTGCVQRLLQTPEGIDTALLEGFPSESAVAEKINGLVSRLDGLLDDKIDDDCVEKTIPAKQKVIERSIRQSLVCQHRLPSSLVSPLLDKSLDGIEANELLLRDMSFSALTTGYRNHRGESALLRAAATGDAQGVRAQLEKWQTAPGPADHLAGALRRAVYSGHAEVAQALAEKIDVNTAESDGLSALMIAARYGHSETVKALLAAPGIEVNKRDGNGLTALMMAACFGQAETVKALLTAPGIEVNGRCAGSTALMLAARYGRTEALQALLSAEGIEINAKDNNGWTALSLAAAKGHTEAVKALLAARGIEVNTQELLGWTPLMLAARFGHTEVTRALLTAKDIQVRLRNIDGHTARRLARNKGHPAIIALLNPYYPASPGKTRVGERLASLAKTLKNYASGR